MHYHPTRDMANHKQKKRLQKPYNLQPLLSFLYLYSCQEKHLRNHQRPVEQLYAYSLHDYNNPSLATTSILLAHLLLLKIQQKDTFQVSFYNRRVPDRPLFAAYNFRQPYFIWVFSTSPRKFSMVLSIPNPN